MQLLRMTNKETSKSTKIAYIISNYIKVGQIGADSLALVYVVLV